MAVAESRQELLNWLNATLNLNYTKIEQCGTGAAYCQLFDSIYYDIPMSKVKYDGKSDYVYINNYKVLQAAFLKHHIEKTIFVERLIKCRFQDNLEFLQFMRKFWNENKDDSPYDPDARRKSLPGGSGAGPGAAHHIGGPRRLGSGVGQGARAPSTTSGPRRGTPNSSVGRPPAAGARTTSRGSTQRGATPSGPSGPSGGSGYGRRGGSSVSGMTGSRAVPGARAAASSRGGVRSTSTPDPQLLQQLSQANETVTQLQSENQEMNGLVEGLETERNFYFNKLREIEIVMQTISDDLGLEDEDNISNAVEELKNLTVSGTSGNHWSLYSLVKQIQEVLYSTEDGFQVPVPDEEDNGEVEIDPNADYDGGNQQEYDDETF